MVLVCITGTHYCGNIFCQPFVNYVDLSSCFNNAIPRLAVPAKRLHCSCRPIRRTSSGCSTGHQTSRISIRLTTRSGAFCKSECVVARYVTSTIWKNDWFMNGDIVCVAVSAKRTDTLNNRFKHWVTLSFRNTKVLHHSVTPNNQFNT